MKTIWLYLMLLIGLLFSSCEDVVEIDLNYTNERLVIEGQLNWIKETKKTEQLITLSKTTPYYENIRIPASGAEVFIKDEQNNTYSFKEKENTGIYYPLDSLPFLPNEKFFLEIEFENQKYRGEEVSYPVAPIYEIKQDSILIFGTTATQIEAYSQDPEEEVNYTYFEFSSARLENTEYNVYRDDFSNGSQYYGVLLDRDFEKGDQVRIRQYSISKTAYHYWFLLLLQNTQQGGPFQTTPANLNSNVVNLTKPENSPLGYFRVSEVSEVFYTIK